ncbi:mechanosensitive ion channel family protein [Halomonas sp. YLGW01]|uniref:mechanosensitive ion channel family protein n=1 Tax=Halomonas sp. YLGW01 TaxID=2773308 RepID=UPI00177AFDF7|nr:mechanosensitive ion channel family protein [Halomonas sp. YLGW01]
MLEPSSRPSPASQWLIRGLLALMVMLLLPSLAQGQASGLGLSGLAGESSGSQPPPRAVVESLDTVIATLENAERRGALLEELKALRTSTAEVEGGRAEAGPQGLLGALADTFNELGEQAEDGQSPLNLWHQRLIQAWQDAGELVRNAGNVELLRLAVEAAVMLSVWVGLLLSLMALARLMMGRFGLPLELPREPKAWLLGVHFLRRLLPWAVAFAIMLAMAQLVEPNAAVSLALVTAYVSLCGRLLASSCEVVFSAFTRGHRYVAVRSLRTRALKRLFLIGALMALGDALDASRLTIQLGEDLASFLSIVTNLLAALMSGVFILRFKQPIKHLIRHRPYSQRKVQSTTNDVIRVLGGLWHVPALLMVGVSLVALVVTVGDAGEALPRAIGTAALLILTLVITGLLRRYGDTLERRKRISQYRRRLERFGYTLSHMLCWAAFAELSMRIWGGSLLGVGQEAAGARIGQALIGIGFTVLVAWLAWIFADTAIQRALSKSGRSRGRRVNSARAQTITPLIRNVVFTTIVVIASIVALANLGVNVTPLLAGAGVIGLAIGFGAQTLVQDLITGIFILIEDSLAIDDFVDLGGHLGTVEGLTLRTVRLRDLDGIVHTITFSQIKSIHNMSRQFGIALMRLRIPHAMKIDDAISLVREVADDLRQDPLMRHHIWSTLEMQGIERFEEGAAVLRMRMRTAPVMQWDVARAFNLRFKQRLEADGLELAMPRLSLQMEGRSGDALYDQASEMNQEGERDGSASGRDVLGRSVGEAGRAAAPGAPRTQGSPGAG